MLALVLALVSLSAPPMVASPVSGMQCGVASATGSGGTGRERLCARSQQSIRTLRGTIAGAAYLIEVPGPWNRTLVLYSHGTTAPGGSNPAEDAPDSRTGTWLLAHGYALAGSAFSTTGWAVRQALHDQVALLDFFDQKVGIPSRTITWGDSQGGLIAAGLIQRYPKRFSAALPMCGALSGSVGSWNAGLDAAFAFKTLAAPRSRLHLVHIAYPVTDYLLGQAQLLKAQLTPKGRARIALAAALYDIPGWHDSSSPQPAATDYRAQERSQYQWEQEDWGLAFVVRADMENKVGGNPSWNAGVDYQKQLAASVDRAEVQALYRSAGLSLDADLRTLARASRIKADAGALSRLAHDITFDGKLATPVLTIHTTGDGMVPVENEQAYAAVVRSAGDSGLLRQIYVHRAGHCSFTSAERITAFQTLLDRLNTGRWDNTADFGALNRRAAGLGPALNSTRPAFVSFAPAPYLRPYVSRKP